jgi:hypothetical protein
VAYGSNVFNSIGYSKFVYTIDKPIVQWGHVTKNAFVLGVMTLFTLAKNNVEGRCVLLQVTAIQLHNYPSHRKTRSS